MFLEDVDVAGAEDHGVEDLRDEGDTFDNRSTSRLEALEQTGLTLGAPITMDGEDEDAF